MEKIEGYVDPCLPEGVKFALHVVKAFFGDVPEMVCAALLHQGPLTLRELTVSTGLPKRYVSNALIVMVQHSLAAALLHEKVGAVGELQMRVVYKADAVRIMHLIRQPKCLMLIADTLGEWAERVTEVVMEFGRLTFEDITQRLAAKYDITQSQAQQHVSRALFFLMKESYIEQAPPCDLPLMFSDDPRKPKRKKAKGDDKAHLQHAHELTMANYEKIRFRVPPAVLETYVKGDVVDESAAMDDDAEGAGGENDDANGDSVVLLRVNFESFDKTFRHNACVDMVNERYGKGAGVVVKAILQLSRDREVSWRENESVHVSLPAILNQIAKINEAQTDASLKFTEDPYSVLLELLEHELPMVTTNASQAWAVCLGNASSAVHFQVMSAYLKQRFGERGFRVWNILSTENYLQAEHIEKEAMINTRDVRTLIYAMLRAGYVDIQEVPKSAEHAPSKTIFTYGVTYFKTHTKLITDLYHAAGNLLSRHNFEMEREKTILELANRKVHGDTIKMSAKQLQVATRLASVQQALHTSLLQLDNMLLTMSLINKQPH